MTLGWWMLQSSDWTCSELFAKNPSQEFFLPCAKLRLTANHKHSYIWFSPNSEQSSYVCQLVAAHLHMHSHNIIEVTSNHTF